MIWREEDEAHLTGCSSQCILGNTWAIEGGGVWPGDHGMTLLYAKRKRLTRLWRGRRKEEGGEGLSPLAKHLGLKP